MRNKCCSIALQATIMTDPETADKTYIGPMTLESVEKIIAQVSRSWAGMLGRQPDPFHHHVHDTNIRVFECTFIDCPSQERPDAVLPTMGGQTALNLAKGLSEVSRPALLAIIQAGRFHALSRLINRHRLLPWVAKGSEKVAKAAALSRSGLRGPEWGTGQVQCGAAGRQAAIHQQG